jgi:hypothetical protein
MSASTVAKSNACTKPLIIRCASLSDRTHAAPALSSPHALRHEAVLGRTVKRHAVRAHCFASAGVPLALLHEAHLAAPWSGLPPALTVLLSQDCAATVLTTKQLIKAATTIIFIVCFFPCCVTTEIPRSF